MANKRITELQLKAALTDTCNFPIDDTIQSYRVTALQLKTYLDSFRTVGIKTVSSAGYTILDTDGYDVVNVSTGASDRAIVLPVAANNIGRKILIRKSDSGAGAVTIDGNGSDTINAATDPHVLHVIRSFMEVVAVASGTWIITGVSDYIRVRVAGATCTASNTWQELTGGAVSVPPGEWDAKCTFEFAPGNASSISRIQYALGLGATTSETGFIAGETKQETGQVPVWGTYNEGGIVQTHYSFTAGTAVYMKHFYTYSSANPNTSATLILRRVG